MPQTLKKQYWYQFTVFECPVCGRGKTYKERVYEKPKLHEKYIYHQSYDWCEG